MDRLLLCIVAVGWATPIVWGVFCMYDTIELVGSAKHIPNGDWMLWRVCKNKLGSLLIKTVEYFVICGVVLVPLILILNASVMDCMLATFEVVAATQLFLLTYAAVKVLLV